MPPCRGIAICGCVPRNKISSRGIGVYYSLTNGANGMSVSSRPLPAASAGLPPWPADACLPKQIYVSPARNARHTDTAPQIAPGV